MMTKRAPDLCRCLLPALLLAGCATQTTKAPTADTPRATGSSQPEQTSSPPVVKGQDQRPVPKEPLAENAKPAVSDQPETHRSVPKKAEAMPEPPPKPIATPQPQPKPAPTPSKPKPKAKPKPAVTSKPEPAPVSVETVEQPTVLRHRVTGQVRVVDPRGSDRESDASEIIVYFVPEGGIQQPLTPGTYAIQTRDKRFNPSVMAVPVGSTIEFPNGDDILHNAFSLSSGNGFDLGLYGLDESRSAVFNQPGLVLVHCNVHHAMQADILVLETPYFTQASEDGRFTLDQLPQGGGNIYFWHPRAKLESRNISIPAAQPVSASLTAVRPRVPKHLNKFGESYRPTRD